MKDLIQIKELSKREIKNIVGNIEDLIQSGHIDPLEVYLNAKAYAEVSKKIIDSRMIKDGAFNEAEKYKGESIHGCRIDFSQTGDRLNYPADNEYAQIEKALKDRKDLLKQAYDSKKKDVSVIDEKSGEIVEPPPIKKKSEAVMKITFKD